MFGNPIGAKGAQKHQASTTAKTGSFLVIQAMVSSSAIQADGTAEAAAVDGVNSHISQSGAYAKFTNITWGNAKEVNVGNYSGSANNSTTLQSATDIILRSGERIEGPIYAFTMTTGSCLTYMF